MKPYRNRPVTFGSAQSRDISGRGYRHRCGSPLHIRSVVHPHDATAKKPDAIRDVHLAGEENGSSFARLDEAGDELALYRLRKYKCRRHAASDLAASTS
jgi:hypothetical protein